MPRRSAVEREMRRLRRHEHLRQIKGRFVHSDRWHGLFKHPGDETLEQWLKLLPVKGSVLGACDARHLRKIEEAGRKVFWHVEEPPEPDDVLLGKLPRPPNMAGPLQKFKVNTPLAGAFVCSRLQKQESLHAYLVALRCFVAPGCPIALIVPNAHHELVDDHVNLFTVGTLVYNLVRAGWDCRRAQINFDGRFINLLVKRRDVPEPWPVKVDELQPYVPFRNVFQYCSSEFVEVYRAFDPDRWY